MCKDQYLKHLRREIKDLPELEQKRDTRRYRRNIPNGRR